MIKNKLLLDVSQMSVGFSRGILKAFSHKEDKLRQQHPFVAI
jgi:hypothetical protein